MLSVVLAQVILAETYPYYVWLSLLPIIAGCSLAAMKEVGGCVWVGGWWWLGRCAGVWGAGGGGCARV